MTGRCTCISPQRLEEESLMAWLGSIIGVQHVMMFTGDGNGWSMKRTFFVPLNKTYRFGGIYCSSSCCCLSVLSSYLPVTSTFLPAYLPVASLNYKLYKESGQNHTCASSSNALLGEVIHCPIALKKFTNVKSRRFSDLPLQTRGGKYFCLHR